MALMLFICSVQPNWMPRKPKLIFQICQKLKRGLCMQPAPTKVSKFPILACSSAGLEAAQALRYLDVGLIGCK